MTMRATVVNRGNRTGDVLIVRRMNPDGTSDTKRLKRGDAFDLDAPYHGAVTYEVQAEMAESDDWVGNPQLTVTDPPRGSTT